MIKVMLFRAPCQNVNVLLSKYNLYRERWNRKYWKTQVPKCMGGIRKYEKHRPKYIRV